MTNAMVFSSICADSLPKEMPDLQQATEFLECLAGHEPITFQTFAESRSQHKGLIKILHGSLLQHSARLESLNVRGAGVFAMVNAGDQKGRRTANVIRVRAAFVDLDGAPLEPVLAAPLKPHMVVESSPSRYHAYWLVDGLPLDQFRMVQECLALRFESDPKVKDLPRVMRLPGFQHRKSEPYLTRLIDTTDAPRVRYRDFLDAFGIDPATRNWKSDTGIPEGQRDETLFQMALGYVNKGMVESEIRQRLLVTNEKRCVPPLHDVQLDKIVRSALAYGPDGALSIEYRLMDSPEYRNLSPGAMSLDVWNRRRVKGNESETFSLRPEDVPARGFSNRRTLRKYREELIDAGFLVVERAPLYGRSGESRECGLYRIANPELGAKNAIKTPIVYGKKYPPNVVHINKQSSGSQA